MRYIEERMGWAPKRRYECHEPSTKEDSSVTFFLENIAHRDAETLHSLAVHLLQWQDGPGRAHKSFNLYGYLFSK